MASKKPTYELENAIISGLAKGFARSGDAGLDTALHGEGLWEMQEKLRRNPSTMMRTAEEFEAFVTTRKLITAKVVELKAIDPER